MLRLGVRRALIWASSFAAALTASDLLLYWWTFAPAGNWWTRSQDSEDWARFGEFIGGTLGPAFALLAFGAAAFAILEQSRQASIDELQRLMNSTSEGINKLLAAPHPKLDAIAAQQFHEIGSFGLLLSAVYERFVRSSADAKPLINLAITVLGGCIHDASVALSKQLVRLIALIKEHEKQGGFEAIRQHYRDQYREQVCGMHIAGTLTSDWVREFFTPVECIKIAQGIAAREV